MNPAIHQPFWYAATGLLSHDEAMKASPTAVLVPAQLAQFQASRWRIECIAERWAIVGASPDATDEVVNVACEVFKILTWTPVSAFGLNFDLPGRLRRGRAPFDQLQGALGTDEFSPKQFAFSRKLTDLAVGPTNLLRTLNASLELKDEADAMLRGNAHHDLRQESSHFDLTPPLRAAYDDARGAMTVLAETIFSENA